MGFRAPNEHVPWRICCWWYGTWLTASIKLCCYLYVGIRTVDSDNVPKLPKPFVMLFNRSHFNFAEYLLFVSENVNMWIICGGNFGWISMILQAVTKLENIILIFCHRFYFKNSILFCQNQNASCSYFGHFCKQLCINSDNTESDYSSVLCNVSWSLWK